jgi:hypothetical protein
MQFLRQAVKVLALPALTIAILAAGVWLVLPPQVHP